MSETVEKLMALVDVGLRQELGKPRYFQLAFDRGDAQVVIPRQMHDYEVETLREWMALILRSAERTAIRPTPTDGDPR